MAAEEWIRVSRERPCPICGKGDNCSTSRDGSAVWCGRVSDGSIQSNAGGQFLHVQREREDSPAWPRRIEHRPKGSTKWPSGTNKAESKPPPKDWGRISKEAFDDPSAESARHTLAAELGVDVEALVRLGVGLIPSPRDWTNSERQSPTNQLRLKSLAPSQRYWTWPERDAAGNVIGINRRFADGTKQRMAGSQSGLTFDPAHWLESMIEPDFVLLVEGGSDVAAMLSLGLAVVGRPSNTGGVELLAELLRDVSVDRADCKSHRPRKPVASCFVGSESQLFRKPVAAVVGRTHGRVVFLGSDRR